VSDGLLQALLRQALLLSVGVVALMLLRPLLLRRLGAQAAYAAWLLVPALLLTAALPRPALEPVKAWVGVGAGALLAKATAAAHPGRPATAVALLAAWLAGACMVIAWQAGRQWRLSRVGARLPDGSSPCLVGVLRPRLLLPSDFEQRFSADERELILAHEAVHQHRRDNAWNALACALAAVHWWNPLAWLAWRHMRADQELACDAAVMAAQPQARPQYTGALLKAHGLHTHFAPLASRWVSAHPLVERIAMLQRPQAPRVRRAVVLSMLIAGVSALGYAAQAQSPPAAADGAQFVDIRLALAVGEFKASPRLITALGVPSRIEWGNQPDAVWRLDMTVSRADDGQLQVDTRASLSDRAVGQHTDITPSGASFTQALGGNDGLPQLRMTRVVTLLPADFKLPAKGGKAP